jgi:peroxin-5
MIGIRLWNELRGSELPPPAEDLAKWEAEFNQLMSSQREEMDDGYGEAMQRAWENGIGDYESEPSKMQFDDGGVPILEDYVFGMPFDCRAMNLRFTPYMQTKKIPT